MNSHFLAHTIAEKMLAHDAFSQLLGIEIVTAEASYSVCSMTISDSHVNGHGSCHGGAIFSLADTTFAHLCNADNTVAVGQMCQIAYWRPAIVGDTLFACATKNGVYGRSGSYSITIHKDSVDGEIIAEFTGFSRSLKDHCHIPDNKI